MTSSGLDLGALATAVPDGRVIEDPDLLTSYEVPERGVAGVACFVVEPGTVTETSSVAAWAYERHVRLVVQGANTGLVGASTPDTSGVQGVLSVIRLDRILDLSVEDRIVVVESGVRLDMLNRVLEGEGLFFPIELGADPSIGGLVATNAGGAHTIRYGDVRSRVAGVEGVLADEVGSIVGRPGVVPKDNTRLGVERLLIGSFGALGVITRVSLKVALRPTAVAAAMLALSSHHDVIPCLMLMEERFGGLLSAFEFISGAALDLALDKVPGLRPPFSTMGRGCYVLVEVSGRGGSGELEEALAEALDRICSRSPSMIEDAVVAPPSDLWSLRHSLSEGVGRAGMVLPFDLSVPRRLLPSLRDRVESMLDDLEVRPLLADFGHWGAGGTHCQLVFPSGASIDELSVRERVYDVVVGGFGGSFSAEHGIGRGNAHFYRRYVPEHEQELEQRLKTMLDPRGVWGTEPFSTP